MTRASESLGRDVRKEGKRKKGYAPLVPLGNEVKVGRSAKNQNHTFKTRPIDRWWPGVEFQLWRKGGKSECVLCSAVRAWIVLYRNVDV